MSKFNNPAFTAIVGLATGGVFSLLGFTIGVKIKSTRSSKIRPKP